MGPVPRIFISFVENLALMKTFVKLNLGGLTASDLRRRRLVLRGGNLDLPVKKDCVGFCIHAESHTIVSSQT